MDLTTLGHVLLSLATLAAIGAVAVIIFGMMADEKDSRGIFDAGYMATWGVFGFMTLSVVLLASAFLGQNFTLEYVAYNHPTDVSSLAWLYRLSGIWAGREGSLLFWAWLISLFAAYVAMRRFRKNDRLSSVALAITNVVQILFLVLLFTKVNDPFKAIQAGYLDPATGKLLVSAGMNALLQNPWMVAHPPTLFIGYAGLTIPFAYAGAALITGDLSKRWVQLSDRITVFSWLLLGVGIGLGAVWAYVELAFGGYWAWDPVENASLLPWFTGVALVHSMTAYRRRESFKWATIVMAASTFFYVILGTFITRSGILSDSSVHTFLGDVWSTVIFGSLMLGAVLLVAIGLPARWKSLKGEWYDKLLSKEGSYTANNLIMWLSALFVTLLTLGPAVGLKYGASSFEAVARPLGIIYILLMTACPILAWGGAGAKAFFKKAKWPLAGSILVFAGLMTVYFTSMLPNYPGSSGFKSAYDQFIAIIGLLVASMAIALPVYLYAEGARKRAAARGENVVTAFFNIFFKARTQSGGYLTHFGMGVILIGLIGSTMFVRTADITLDKGGNAALVPYATQVDVLNPEAHGSYALALTDITEGTAPNGDGVLTAVLAVSKDGRQAREYTPRIVFPVLEEGRRTQKVALVQEPLRDVFISFYDWADDGASGSFEVKVFPMISWVWAGFAILSLGSALAAWPKATRAAA